jgi:hypothetical protein
MLFNGVPPNTIVISENSYFLLRKLIEGEQISIDTTLQGIPLNAIYRVIGERFIGELCDANLEDTPHDQRPFNYPRPIKRRDASQKFDAI